MPKNVEVGAALANCRALINQIDAGLSAEEPFINVSSAAELLFDLEFAASALQRDATNSGPAHPPLQHNQLMSECRVLCLESALRLERRGKQGQEEAEQRNHRR